MGNYFVGYVNDNGDLTMTDKWFNRPASAEVEKAMRDAGAKQVGRQVVFVAIKAKYSVPMPAEVAWNGSY